MSTAYNDAYLVVDITVAATILLVQAILSIALSAVIYRHYSYRYPSIVWRLILFFDANRDMEPIFVFSGIREGQRMMDNLTYDTPESDELFRAAVEDSINPDGSIAGRTAELARARKLNYESARIQLQTAPLRKRTLKMATELP